ncbi:MAG TPA: hypothetical protein VKP68_10615 [Ramlibacter sp.]|nr:hypothetical protein [Ramlibacter sp.]
MRKLILMAVAVAGLAAGASAMAQASQYDQATAGGTRPADVPPGTIRGPSGELQYWQGNRNRGYVDPRYGANVYPDGYTRYGYADGYPPAAVPAWQQPPRRANSRDWQAQRRDSDGDGVPDYRDRRPNDPNRR